MPLGRFTTTHDKAALRLHPDGTRATENTKAKRRKPTTHDIRGNIIAQDACGPIKAKQRKRRFQSNSTQPNNDEEEGEVFDLDGVDSASGDDDPGGSTSTQLKKTTTSGGDGGSQDLGLPNKKISRKTVKRRRFEEDYSFLAPSLSLTESLVVGSPAGIQAQNPSPELLKAIHYFASRYYDQMGQLYDATKFSRSEEKRRKEEKKAMQQQAGPSRHVSTSNNSADIGEDDGADNDVEGKQRKRRKGVPKHDTHRMRDMYKAFDGTALIAIGALVQQFVQDMVEGQVPDGWEAEMLAYEKKEKRKGKGRATSVCSKHAEGEDADGRSLTVEGLERSARGAANEAGDERREGYMNSGREPPSLEIDELWGMNEGFDEAEDKDDDSDVP